jgi:hypothetical protein
LDALSYRPASGAHKEHDLPHVVDLDERCVSLVIALVRLDTLPGFALLACWAPRPMRLCVFVGG